MDPFLLFLLSSLISFVFYIVPVLIYRFGIRKQPIQPRMKAQLVTFLFFICSMVALHLFNFLLASASGEEIDSIQLGLLDVICYIVNSFILMHEEKQSKPVEKSSPVVNDEAEHWKKQYFDLYTRTQQSDQSPSPFDGLSDQEIEQVRQYVDYLKKTKLKINPIADSDPSVPDDDAPPSPSRPTQPVEVSIKDAKEAYIVDGIDVSDPSSTDGKVKTANIKFTEQEIRFANDLQEAQERARTITICICAVLFALLITAVAVAYVVSQ